MKNTGSATFGCLSVFAVLILLGIVSQQFATDVPKEKSNSDIRHVTAPAGDPAKSVQNYKLLTIWWGVKETETTITAELEKNETSSGSKRQAELLLALIAKFPGKIDYRVAHDTGKNVLIIGYNKSKNVLIRINQRSDGHGTTEEWQGYATERLLLTAAGGSFNDTKNGKINGTWKSF